MGGAGSAGDGVQRDRPGARGGSPVTSGRSIWNCRETRSRRGRLARIAPEGLPPSDPDALREAIDEAAELLLHCNARPVILADVEIHRFGLQDDLVKLAESTGMPIATTILGKSVISESHPLFARRL